MERGRGFGRGKRGYDRGGYGDTYDNKPNGGICSFFMEGSCKKGLSCNFKHPDEI